MTPIALTPLQERLLSVLQDGVPVVPRPFAVIAESIGSSEMAVLNQIMTLKRQGIIRRIGPVIDYRVLGRVTTLVTAHVTEPSVEAVAAAVSALPGVSHNYLREHHYNLWFTLQADSSDALDALLKELSTQQGVEFHSLPAVRFFKLDVHFGPRAKKAAEEVSPAKTPVVLTDAEKDVLTWMQRDFEVITSPFVCGEDESALKIVQSLVERGVVKRIAVTVDYRRLGFAANTMFCSRVSQEKIDAAGRALASLDVVSHCYERKVFPGWPFNLFAMMHAHSAAELDLTVSRFVAECGIGEFVLLPTVRQFKKSPVVL